MSGFIQKIHADGTSRVALAGPSVIVEYVQEMMKQYGRVTELKWDPAPVWYSTFRVASTVGSLKKADGGSSGSDPKLVSSSDSEVGAPRDQKEKH